MSETRNAKAGCPCGCSCSCGAECPCEIGSCSCGCGCVRWCSSQASEVSVVPEFRSDVDARDRRAQRRPSAGVTAATPAGVRRATGCAKDRVVRSSAPYMALRF